MTASPITAVVTTAGVRDRTVVARLLVAQLREHAITTSAAAIARTAEGMLRHPERGIILLARVGRRPVGIAALSFLWTLEHGGRAIWLDELYVVPALRGRGIGRRLLLAAMEAAAAAGAVALDLEVERTHARAANLYEREGFARLDRVRWARSLTPAATGTRARRGRPRSAASARRRS